jgi:hypothetical protein
LGSPSGEIGQREERKPRRGSRELWSWLSFSLSLSGKTWEFCGAEPCRFWEPRGRAVKEGERVEMRQLSWGQQQRCC